MTLLSHLFMAQPIGFTKFMGLRNWEKRKLRNPIEQLSKLKKVIIAMIIHYKDSVIYLVPSPLSNMPAFRMGSKRIYSRKKYIFMISYSVLHRSDFYPK